jgi:predicted secreted hydrolase
MKPTRLDQAAMTMVWLTGAVALWAGACRRPAEPGSTSGTRTTSPSSFSATGAAGLSVSGLLSDATGAAPDRDGVERGTAGYARALAPRLFRFPDDDGPHAEFRSEWWYFTGVLRGTDAAGRARRIGYEMSLFRQALAPHPAARPSRWATRDIFMGHFAITDVDGRSEGSRFHAYQRFARDGLALGGARAHPFAVWVDDWRMESRGGGDGAPLLPMDLTARDDDGGALALRVGDSGAGRGPILQGDRGLSTKGPAPGDASYYYSRTRLPTQGRVTIPNQETGATETLVVTGLSWMDREWSTAGLPAGVQGWDWLGAHLSDGRDLMLYRLRGADGGATAESLLTLIAADGTTRRLGPAAFTLTPLSTWVSPRSGARYPTSIRLDVPGESLRLVVRPLAADQELRLAVVYWEGAASIEGTSAGVPLSGEGYLELTGYEAGVRAR